VGIGFCGAKPVMSDNKMDFEHFWFCSKAGSFGFNVELCERKGDQWYCREDRLR
jgi:hypothetical protein